MDDVALPIMGYLQQLSDPTLAPALREEVERLMLEALHAAFGHFETLEEQHEQVWRALYNADADGVLVGPFKAFVFFYHGYTFTRCGKDAPFRTLKEHELELLAMLAALGSRGARAHRGGALADDAVITLERFNDFWFAPPVDAATGVARSKFSFCAAMELMALIWDYWNDEVVHGFISGTQAQQFLSVKPAGTFLVRFGSEGGLTIDYMAASGRIEKKNIVAAQLKQMSLAKWLHTMDGHEKLQRLHVIFPEDHPGHDKSECFPLAIDATGYIQPDVATVGAATTAEGGGGGGGIAAAAPADEGYENVADDAALSGYIDLGSQTDGAAPAAAAAGAGAGAVAPTSGGGVGAAAADALGVPGAGIVRRQSPSPVRAMAPTTAALRPPM